jgi:hypothetical protein
MEPKSTEGNLRALPLTWDHCQELSLKLASSEKMECLANGYTPEQALAAGLLFGLSWAVLRDGSPIGAFGYTLQGAVWSLWGPLTRTESADRTAPEPRLDPPPGPSSPAEPSSTNAVHEDNKKALDWLKATGCVVLRLGEPQGEQGRHQELGPSRRTIPQQEPPTHV